MTFFSLNYKVIQTSSVWLLFPKQLNFDLESIYDLLKQSDIKCRAIYWESIGYQDKRTLQLNVPLYFENDRTLFEIESFLAKAPTKPSNEESDYEFIETGDILLFECDKSDTPKIYNGEIRIQYTIHGVEKKRGNSISHKIWIS